MEAKNESSEGAYSLKVECQRGDRRQSSVQSFFHVMFRTIFGIHASKEHPFWCQSPPPVLYKSINTTTQDVENKTETNTYR